MLHQSGQCLLEVLSPWLDVAGRLLISEPRELLEWPVRHSNFAGGGGGGGAKWGPHQRGPPAPNKVK